MADETIDRYPDWNKPATRGDVLQAMIWGQALSTKLLLLVVAIQSGNPAKIAEAKDEYLDESDEYQRKIAQLAGRPENG